MENQVNLPDCPKIMCFDTDDDFYLFAVNPLINIVDDPKTGSKYYDYNLSDNYNNAIKDGIEFIIRDPNSLVAKRNCVSYRTISKPIKNMHPSYYEDDLKYFYPDFKPVDMICDCEE